MKPILETSKENDDNKEEEKDFTNEDDDLNSNNKDIESIVEFKKKPKNHLVLSIITMIVFSFPFGLAALVYSCKTIRQLREGKMSKAELSSKTSIILNVFAIITGTIAIILFIIQKLVMLVYSKQKIT